MSIKTVETFPISEAFELRWHGGYYIELYYYGELLDAYGMGKKFQIEQPKKIDFINFALNFEITEDHLRLVEEARY